MRDSLNEFTDIIKVPDGLPPTRECDFEINLQCDEPPKERTYRMSPAKLREVQVQLQDLLAKVGFIRLNLRTVPQFCLYGCTQEGWYHAYVRRLSETQRPYEETPYTVSPD